MSGIGKKYAALRGRFPGEKEQSLPEMVERLVGIGAVSEPSSELAGKIANIVGATPPDPTPIPAAPAKAEAAPPKPEPVPAAPKPAPAPAPVAKAPSPATAGSASSQRTPVQASPDEVESAVAGIMGSGADSQLMSAVSVGGPLSDRISAKLPAIKPTDDDDSDLEEEDDEDDIPGLSRGEDDELPDSDEEESDSERFVVVEDEPEPTPAVAQAAAPTAAAPGIVVMEDVNIEDVMAGATGPTLADFRASGLSEDWFDDPEFTSGRDSFDAILEGEAVDPGAPVVETKVDRVTQRLTPPTPAAVDPTPIPAAPEPDEPEEEVEEEAAPASVSADEDAADALLADLGLSSTPAKPTPRPAAKPAPAAAGAKPRRYDNFTSVAHTELESAADELLKDIADSIRAKGLEPPGKLSRRIEASAGKPKVEVVQMRDSPPAFKPVEPPTIVEPPKTEPRASTPAKDDRPKVRDEPIQSPPRGRPAVRDTAPETDATPEDKFAETVSAPKGQDGGRTLVLTRAAMDRAGRELVGVAQSADWKVAAGAFGVVLLVSSLVLYGIFVAYTGQF